MFSNWSQDGRWIYFSSNRSGVDQIWRIPSNGGAAVQTTRNGGFAVCQSPDSKYLYYTRSKEQNTSLWRMPAEGGPESQVAKSLVLINYAVTVRGIYFMTQPDLHSGKKLIQFLSVAGEPAKLIASTERDVYAGFAVSPDERWLLFAQREPGSSDLVLVENFE